MSRVLLTGATGFVGRHVVRCLVHDGHTVHATSRSSNPDPELASLGVLLHPIDLLDERSHPALLKTVKPTHLLHLAWCAEPGSFWESPDNDRWLNASKSLIESFLACGGERAVVASSGAVYEWNEKRCVEDSSALHPASRYGRCKLALEQALDDQSQNTAWARIFFAFGPGEPAGRLIPSATLALLTGKSASFPGGLRRDFLYVKDVARALVELLESEVQGPVNVASGTATPISDLLSQLAALAGQTEILDLERAPTAQEPPLVEASVERLTNEVGFTAQFELGEALGETLDWWRKRAPGLARN